VTFAVSGTIQLKSTLTIKNANITIAGQTAPGGGIQLETKGLASVVMNINAHDLVIRYLKIRKGYASTCTYSMQNCGSNVVIYGSYNIMLDHLSLAWSQDDSLGMWSAGTLRDVTAQYSIVAEGFTTQATGTITGAPSSTTAAGMTNIDLHHNYTVSFDHRGPFAGNKTGREVNTIAYNLKQHTTQLYGGISYDSIGNIKKKGPLSVNGYYEFEGLSNSSGGDATNGSPSMYMSGNIGWNQTNPAGDQWSMARQVTSYNGQPTGTIPTGWRRTSPLANTAYPIIAEPVGNLAANLMPIVGASQKLTCGGTFTSNRDTTDTRLVNQYINNTGNSSIITNETQVGGYPTIANGTPCADVDHDGMPDVWETARGLNPNNAADRNTVATNGYTNLENYLGGV
jgi:hypothetical protein